MNKIQLAAKIESVSDELKTLIEISRKSLQTADDAYRESLDTIIIIRDKKLYLEIAPTFQEFCQIVYQSDRRAINREIELRKIIQCQIANGEPVSKNHTQAKKYQKTINVKTEVLGGSAQNSSSDNHLHQISPVLDPEPPTKPSPFEAIKKPALDAYIPDLSSIKREPDKEKTPAEKFANFCNMLDKLDQSFRDDPRPNEQFLSEIKDLASILFIGNPLPPPTCHHIEPSEMEEELV